MGSGAPERFAQAWGLEYLESFVKRNQGPHRRGPWSPRMDGL